MIFHRRNFIKTSATGALTALLPSMPLLTKAQENNMPEGEKIVRFFGDGEMLEPSDYIKELQKIHNKTPIDRDRYGAGGSVEQLEKKFMKICGTEAAIYMPSGTMANQLAVAVLSAGNPKVFVQDESHLFRDEADAAQLVFGKRLIPLAKGETYFTAKALRETIERLPDEEVFQSGIGAVSIECPVRRMNGRMVPIAEIKAISEYCRSKAIPLHLDGARIHMAAAWSGISVKEYASYFDTTYISLYKYLSASGGAILCGSKSVIGKMPNLIKIHGGSMYANWTNAAMALNRLEGIENKIQQAKNHAVDLIDRLNKVKEIEITALPDGTNVYNLKLAINVNAVRFRERLNKSYNIRIGPFNKQNEAKIFINETILYQSAEYLADSFGKALKNS